MYFIVKVKFVEGNQNHPRHKIISQAMTLEETLSNLEKIATDYIIKKLKPSFSVSQQDDEIDTKTKIIYEIKYTMTRSKLDNNIIEIHEKMCKTEQKPALVYGINETTTRTSRQIGYFCYIKCDNLSQTCDKCLTTISRPLPSKVTQGSNPDLVRQLTSNGLFQKCQKSSAANQLDTANELTAYDGLIDEISDLLK